MVSSAEALLPVETLRCELDRTLDRGLPAVITAPTGSGKSTQVPRWCLRRGAVLVVEPRRVACRSLAQRVAELEGCPLGQAVGYSVRDDRRARRDTALLFATTGVALRLFAQGALLGFRTLILDEFHERSLEVDLLLGLFAARRRSDQALVVMSATLEGRRLADHLGGVLLEAEGRLFPVERRYLPGAGVLPEARGLEGRLAQALEAAGAPGDVLVFLPGKAEIASAAQALGGANNLELIPLHGGLSLEEQGRAFAPSPRRKVILATNVAETSITLPGVGVVIDSGLVRRTRYHQGRGYLTLSPIAEDSAEQRAGRAGRTGPGLCLRLWSEAARLEPMTPPAVHREALAPLVLAAAACRCAPEELPLLDPPRDYALESAREELYALGALEAGGGLTERGRRLFGLPVDPFLGRLLVEAEQRGEPLVDVIDLVAALTARRPLFRGPLRPEDDEDDDPRACGCDATALIRALRGGRRAGWSDRVQSFALAEAEQTRARLRRAFGLEGAPPGLGERPDRRRLAMTALAADPRCAHVARARKGRALRFSNGGTELELGRDSAVNTLLAKDLEAIAVLESHALSKEGRKRQLIATCALPLELRWLVEAGLGQDRLSRTTVDGGRVVAEVKRVYARRTLERREEVPEGALAREAIRDLFVRGSLFPRCTPETATRLEAWALLSRLLAAGLTKELLAEEAALWLEDHFGPDRTVPPIEGWALGRLEALGVTSGEELALLGEADFLAPPMPERLRDWLDRSFPRELSLGDARYRLDYDLPGSEVSLVKIAGQRQGPPPPSYLPTLPGFRVVLRDRSRVFVLRP